MRGRHGGRNVPPVQKSVNILIGLAFADSKPWPNATAGVGDKVLGSDDRQPDPPGMHVTPRQAEILRLVAAGLSDKQIASRLGVSPRTIQSHLDRLFLEHGLHKRAAAVAAWLRKRDARETGRPAG
jgi:DNA-binding NarL/FixJ family response regulator